MGRSLKDIFNNAHAKNRGTLEALQELLDKLPQKIVEMQQDHPEKNILFALVPIESADGEFRIVKEMEDIKFAFREKLAESPLGLDCAISGYVSMYGNFLAVAVKAGQKNTLTLLKESGYVATGPEDHYFQMKKNFPEELQRSVQEESEVHSIGFSLIMGIAREMDPQELLPTLAYERHDGTPIPSVLGNNSILYWKVNEAWPKPAEKKDWQPPSFLRDVRVKHFPK